MSGVPATEQHLLAEARQVAVVANTRADEAEAANATLLDTVGRLVAALATATGQTEDVVRVQHGIEVTA